MAENKEFDDDAVFRLTEKAIMQMVLKDFGISVSLTMANAIYREFMDKMVQSGYLSITSGED